MLKERVANRYAKALLAAVKPNELQKVEDEMRLLFGAFSDETLKRFFESPAFDSVERRQIAERLSGELKLSSAVGRFLQFLIERGRISLFGEIAQSFFALADQRLGRMRAQISVSHKMTPEAEAQIVQALERRTQKKVVPEIQIDPSVLFGVRASVGGLLFDGTIDSALNRLEQSLV